MVTPLKRAENPQKPSLEEKIDLQRSEFSKCQKRIIELMGAFEELDMSEMDHGTLFLYENALPDAVDCLEALCERANRDSING